MHVDNAFTITRLSITHLTDESKHIRAIDCHFKCKLLHPTLMYENVEPGV